MVRITNAMRAQWKVEMAARMVVVKAKRRAAMYGLSPADLSALLEDQGNCCGICLKPITVDTAHIDHDHKDGTVRGWLCPACNQLLGMARDSVPVLQAAIRYLEKQTHSYPVKQTRSSTRQGIRTGDF